MAEQLCRLACTTKALCSSLGATRYRMTLDKSITAVCLRSPRRYMLITCDIYRPLWLVSVYGEFKWSSGGTLHQTGLQSRAKASNSRRKNIELIKLSPHSTLYHKVAERRSILLL
jgi:hypothetical protein